MALSKLQDEHYIQLLNYLQCTVFSIDLLTNFVLYPKLAYKRMAL